MFHHFGFQLSCRMEIALCYFPKIRQHIERESQLKDLNPDPLPSSNLTKQPHQPQHRSSQCILRHRFTQYAEICEAIIFVLIRVLLPSDLCKSVFSFDFYALTAHPDVDASTYFKAHFEDTLGKTGVQVISGAKIATTLWLTAS